MPSSLTSIIASEGLLDEDCERSIAEREEDDSRGSVAIVVIAIFYSYLGESPSLL